MATATRSPLQEIKRGRATMATTSWHVVTDTRYQTTTRAGPPITVSAGTRFDLLR